MIWLCTCSVEADDILEDGDEHNRDGEEREQEDAVPGALGALEGDAANDELHEEDGGGRAVLAVEGWG